MRVHACVHDCVRVSVCECMKHHLVCTRMQSHAQTHAHTCTCCTRMCVHVCVMCACVACVCVHLDSGWVLHTCACGRNGRVTHVMSGCVTPKSPGVTRVLRVTRDPGPFQNTKHRERWNPRLGSILMEQVGPYPCSFQTPVQRLGWGAHPLCEDRVF